MLNKNFFGLLLIVSVSCGKSVDNATVETFKYSVDTVSVDSKGHLLYLDYNLRKSDYCQQDEFLYSYNGFDHSIDKIDLDRLEFVEKFPLQVEGPDGLGSRIYTVKSLGNGKLFFEGEITGIITLDSTLVEKIDWNKISRLNGGITDEDYLQQHVVNPYVDNKAFALAIDHSANRVSLKKLNTTDNMISTYEIDPNGNYKKYILGDLTNFNKWDPRVFLTSQQEKIIVSHEFSNDFYVYSSGSDHLEQISYSSNYTPSRVTITTEGDFINSTDDRINALQSYLEQVSFGILTWDSQNKRYYRLSSSSKFGEEKRENRILHETISVKVFLSVFDEHFSLIGEIPIPELRNGSSVKYFVKDGMLWVFENIDDEMGFIRLAISQ